MQKSMTAAQPQPSPRVVYTYADAVAHCPTHRTQHQQAETDHAQFQTANAASIARIDRLTLGLRNTRPAVTA